MQSILQSNAKCCTYKQVQVKDVYKGQQIPPKAHTRRQHRTVNVW